MRIFLCMMFAIWLISPAANARPISYPGGWVAMGMADGESYSAQLDYTIDPKNSIGVMSTYWRDGQYWMHDLTYTHLLQRWNNPDSQGNLYFKSGLGIATSDQGRFDHEVEPAAMIGISGDWEDRRYYVSYENSYDYAGDIDKFFSQKARVGIAPYIGEYGDLHTWLMLQVDHRPWDEDNITVTPLVRLFKGTTLGEIGLSNHGDLMAHLMLLF